MDYVIIYLGMAAVFLVLDSLWLGVVAKRFYQQHIGHLMAKQPNLLAAGVFYLLFLVGLLLLIVVPATETESLARALWSGALFGLVCYGTYDLTSQAVLKDWPLKVTMIDLAWGSLVTTVVAAAGYLISINL